MSGFKPEYLILHDYGGTPKGDAPFNPYHALIAGGRKIYRDPANPYGAPAPHAYKLNPRSIGLSWGGPVGGTPSEDDLRLIREEVEAIKAKYPGIKIKSHGEAFAETKGTPYQASRDGRGLEEAAWRRFLDGTGPMPTGPKTAASAPPPVSARGLTSYAGLTAPQAEAAAPMPTQPTPEAQTMDPKMLAQMLFGAMGGAQGGSAAGAAAPVAGAAPGAAGGMSLPFGMAPQGASSGGNVMPAMPQARSPLAGLQARPMDLSALQQLASIKRRGGLG